MKFQKLSLFIVTIVLSLLATGCITSRHGQNGRRGGGFVSGVHNGKYPPPPGGKYPVMPPPNTGHPGVKPSAPQRPSLPQHPSQQPPVNNNSNKNNNNNRGSLSPR